MRAGVCEGEVVRGLGGLTDEYMAGCIIPGSREGRVVDFADCVMDVSPEN